MIAKNLYQEAVSKSDEKSLQMGGLMQTIEDGINSIDRLFEFIEKNPKLTKVDFILGWLKSTKDGLKSGKEISLKLKLNE